MKAMALVGVILLACALGAGIIFWPEGWRTGPYAVKGAVGSGIPIADVSRPAFDRWLSSRAGRTEDYAAFEQFVARAGYGDMLPAWTMLRAERRRSARCHAEPFVMPPRRVWPNILPALKLVRERVMPAIGAVEVASAFRDTTLNDCSGGAGQSRHMTFSAFDLEPTAQPDATTSFTLLCRAWRRAGAASDWGLGAYYDAAHLNWNSKGRFHVDGTGWRTWGFSKHRASSGCNTL